MMLQCPNVKQTHNISQYCVSRVFLAADSKAGFWNFQSNVHSRARKGHFETLSFKVQVQDIANWVIKAPRDIVAFLWSAKEHVTLSICRLFGDICIKESKPTAVHQAAVRILLALASWPGGSKFSYTGQRQLPKNSEDSWPGHPGRRLWKTTLPLHCEYVWAHFWLEQAPRWFLRSKHDSSHVGPKTPRNHHQYPSIGVSCV